MNTGNKGLRLFNFVYLGGLVLFIARYWYLVVRSPFTIAAENGEKGGLVYYSPRSAILWVLGLLAIFVLYNLGYKILKNSKKLV